MRAITRREYGSADALRLECLPTPTPGDGEVLVRVKAGAVCKGDVHLMTGKPYLVRLMFGLRRPKNIVFGQEFAGTVVAQGAGVAFPQIGDEVFGSVEGGAFAEFACAPSDRLALKPAGLTFEEAAALGDSAVAALQGLRDVAAVRAGQRVLVNGASGGVGTFAVQIATALGADVTAVCSARHADAVRALGADKVVDYTRDDFVALALASQHRFDVLLDLVGNRRLVDCRRALTPNGVLVSYAGAPGRNWLGPLDWMLRTWIVDKVSSQTLRTFLVATCGADLLAIADLVESGRVTPLVEQVFRFEDAAAAVRHVATGHAQGKTVVAL